MKNKNEKKDVVLSKSYQTKTTILPNGMVLYTFVKPCNKNEEDWFDKFYDYWLSKTNSALPKTVS